MSDQAGKESRKAYEDPQRIDGRADASFEAVALTKRVLIVVAVLGGLFAAWVLRDLLLVLFGAVVMAIGLRGSVTVLARRVRVRRRGAFVMIVGMLGVVTVLVGLLVGPDLADNLAVVTDQLPIALENATTWLNDRPWGHRILRGWEADPSLSQLPQLLDLTRVTFSMAASGVVMLIAAIYLSIHPQDYRRLVLDWLPKRQRLLAGRIANAIERALTRWLAAQAAAVAFTAVGMAGVLWSLRVPLGGTVAIAAALMTVVPFVGVVAGAVLVSIMAFTSGVQVAVYAASAWLVIHAISEYGLMPQLQRWSVNLPPVASIFMAVAWASLFGFYGLVLAGPLTVATVAAASVLRGAEV